ncbi:MAG TPA: BlaI/MecI/CopY family transcriptional regulator [Chloroflexia bacterium]|nr:BlaI/MecI/CopY family transcriptional regulator [Chloroflexia bacterium]
MAVKDGAVKFKFNPTQDGITKPEVLGRLESQIMQVVWQMHRATASDVHHELQASRQRENKDIAYTTVMTTMSRLYDKNILSRRKVGMSFVYTAALDQEAFINLVVKNVMDSLVSEFDGPVFRYFVDYIAQDEARRTALTAALAGPAPGPKSPR